MKRGSFGCCVIAAALAFAPAAHANGRFPASNQMVFADSDPNLVLMRMTFGLLVSRDRGASWDFVCEQSIGSTGAEDPMYTVTPTGAIVAATFRGMAVTRDRACTWAFVGGAVDKVGFVDLAARKVDGGEMLGLASNYDRQDDAGNTLFKTDLYGSKDDGKTFTALVGQPIDSSLLAYTVDLTATDPNRIYVSAVRDAGVAPKGVFLRSNDHGATWQETAIPFQGNERSVFIAAVDPKNADRVYVRTENAPDQRARVLVTENGGTTWKSILDVTGGAAGFALSADGSKIYAGSVLDGLFVGNATDYTFQNKSKTEVQCLAVSSDGLWVCSSEKSGFVLGLTKDEGATFQAKLHFCEIRGALACPADAPTSQFCVPAWVRQRADLGCNPGADGGSSGAVGDAGASGAPGLDPGGGCSCRTTTAEGGRWALAVSVVVGAALVAFGRRRKR